MAQSHPKGLYVLFVTEMWERFSYYGMRAIFSLFMIKALLFDKALASTIYGNYTGLVYLTPLLGGYVADKYWGNRKSIFWGGIMMAIGQFMLFGSAVMYEQIAQAPDGFSLAHFFFYGGLGFLIFGNGFFKPNISTMVGQLYPQNDNRLDSAMTIFYMGINLGAMVAPLVAGGLGDTGCPSDFKWGFLAAAIGMLIAIVTFELLKNKYIVTPEGKAVGLPPIREKKAAGEFQAKVNWNQILLYVVLAISLFYFFYSIVEFDFIGSVMFSVTIMAPLSIILDKTLTRIEKERIGVIYICAVFVIFFWSAFEQAGVSLTFFAEEQTNRNVFGWTMPASYFQSFNAAFIVIFAPIVAWLWVKLGEKGMEPASPYKQSIGLFLLAIGYLFIAFGVKGIDPDVKVSMMWLVGLYFLHTMGELSLSPIGLSMVVKLSPAKFTSLLMGVWFMAIATANKFAGILSGLYPEEQKREQVYAVNDQVIDESTFVWYDDIVTDIEVAPVFSDVSIDKDRVTGIAAEVLPVDFEVYKALRVLKENKLMLTAEELEESKSKICDVQDDLGRFTYGISSDGKTFYLIRELDGEKNLQQWNLQPEKPKFAGFKINTLYDFFMIFVFMAGGASVILFFISKKLLKMMNGVR
ncbi:MAG: MFS transporter [Flavobacteriales bacterium]|nr:MAG: MFS transporter [Flavobacteriales bacterium]